MENEKEQPSGGEVTEEEITAKTEEKTNEKTDKQQEVATTQTNESQQSTEEKNHSHPPIDPELQQPAKRQKKSSNPNDMGFGFDNESFSDHKLSITVEGQTSEPRIVHVSKLLIFGKSEWFRENMTSNITSIVLNPQHKVEHFVDIIRWMYVHSFETTGIDLLDVMTLAYKFSVLEAVTKCANDLVTNFMSVSTACKYIEHEIRMREEFPKDDKELAGFKTLWDKAKEFLREKYKNFTMEVWTSKEFLEMGVEGLKVVLASNELKVGCENTVFASLRYWVHMYFEERKHLIAQVLPLIRFPLIHHNYLLDVVRTEAEMDYPEGAKQAFVKQILDAYVYHCCSIDRLEALHEYDIPKRAYTADMLSMKFYWKIPNISQKKEIWSEPFFLGGYFLYLLMQRKNVTGKGGGTIGLYMHLKLKESGLGQNFFLPLAFELLVRNKILKKYISSKGVYASPFTFQNRAWGYMDILGMTWEDFLNQNCAYNDNDCLYVKACVAFKDYLPRQHIQ